MTVHSPSPTFATVARFALDTHPTDIPEPVRARAALLLLDTLGVAAAAAPMDAGEIARNTAVAVHGAGHSIMTAPLLFDGRQVSLPGAAFALASQIDNLDAHDGYNPTKGHIGVAVVPSLCALAHQLPGLTGPEALAALAVGYEIAGRAGTALHATVSDYHTSGAWNALGVVAMAARLRGLRAGQLREALGIAEYHGPRSQMMREIAHPTMLHDGSGWGALGGMQAVIMAEMGFTGAPAITVEAPEVTPHWSDLGQHWQTLDQYIKPYPICRWAHAPIDAAGALAINNNLDHDEISSIEIVSFDEAVALFPGMPQTTSQAQYSLPFAVAARLVHGQIGLDAISGAGLSDPRVARLVDVTTKRSEQRFNDTFPAHRRAEVTLTLTDGRRLSSGIVEARGGKDTPLSDREIIDKFHAFADPVLGVARAVALRNAALSLVDTTTPFSNLTHHLTEAP